MYVCIVSQQLHQCYTPSHPHTHTHTDAHAHTHTCRLQLAHPPRTSARNSSVSTSNKSHGSVGLSVGGSGSTRCELHSDG